MDYHLVVGMDTNTVINPLIARSSSTIHGDLDSQPLNDLISHNDLCDTWRMKNEYSRDCTFYSSRHKTFSRIDYIII